MITGKSEPFETERSFDGDAGALLDFLATTLTAQGFHVGDRTDDSLRAAGPSMRSSNQGPVLGAGVIDIACDGSRVRMTADRSGTAFLKGFLFMMTMGSIVITFLIFGVLAYLGHVPWPVIFVPILLGVLDPIVVSVMAKGFDRRTDEALENLLDSAINTVRP
ncbi:MAG: hypothetical protein AAGD00_07725 [Planctomycetota bacterium]